jgi:hypothetical protein
MTDISIATDLFKLMDMYPNGVYVAINEVEKTKKIAELNDPLRLVMTLAEHDMIIQKMQNKKNMELYKTMKKQFEEAGEGWESVDGWNNGNGEEWSDAEKDY